MSVVPNWRSDERVFTPKELRHIAQGCLRSGLPWETDVVKLAPTPTGLCLMRIGRNPVGVENRVVTVFPG